MASLPPTMRTSAASSCKDCRAILRQPCSIHHARRDPAQHGNCTRHHSFEQLQKLNSPLTRSAHYLQMALASTFLGLPGIGKAGELMASDGWEAPALPQTYVPGPVDVGWEIWVGFAAGLIPFMIGSWEFGKRIIIQRRCQVCSGSGLVERGRFLRKCPECGGFFPWLGWKTFFTSTAAPGNGGVLRAPRGQTSVFYRIPSAEEASRAAEEFAAAERAAAEKEGRAEDMKVKPKAEGSDQGRV